MATGTALLGRTGLVALGVTASGIGTLVMLGVSAHGSSVSTFATVATWWVLATLVAYPFGVFETYLTRLVVTDRARGRSPRASVATMTGRAGALALVMAAIGTALDPVLRNGVFRDVPGLGPFLGLFCLIGALQALVRGYAAGTGRFGTVSLQLSLDGVGRAVAVTVVVVLRPDDVYAQVTAICLGAGLSVVLAALRCPEWWNRPRWSNGAVGHTEVVVLLVGAIGPILINNLSVPWLSHVDVRAALVGAFSGALTLSRVPVQLAGAAFGPLLTEISHLVESGDRTTLRRMTLRASALAAAVAAVFVIGFTLLGPWVLTRFIGARYQLPTWVFLELGAATGVMLVAVVMQSRVAAQERWIPLAASWMLGAVVFVAVLALPLPVLVRAAVSPLAAVVAALLALVWVIRSDDLADAQPDGESVTAR